MAPTLELNQHIAITGIGVIGPFGIGRTALWECLNNNQTNFGPCSRYKSPLACSESVQPNLRKMLRSSQLSRAPLISQFAAIVIHMALEQANLKLGKNIKEKCIGLLYGTSNGAGSATQKIYDDLIDKGASGVKPRIFQESVFNAPASLSSIHFKLKGPIQVLPSSIAGTSVLYQAQMLLASPAIKVVIALCSDELCEAIQSALRILRWHTAAPTDDLSAQPKKNKGAIMSEGAVALVLERASMAHQRGAKPLAELAGVGIANDAFQIAHLAEDGRGLIRAMKQCLADSKESTSTIDFILAGSVGTKVNNQLEKAAIRRLYNYEVPHATSKRHIGVAMGASTLFDVALAIEILRRNHLPKTLAGTQSKSRAISSIMCNEIGMNGLYGATVIRRPAW